MIKKSEAKKAILIISAAYVMGTAGCSPTVSGKVYNYNAANKIYKNVSTNNDIRSIFGEPMEIRKNEQEEVWIYYVTFVNLVWTHSHNLDVYFNDNNIVTNYNYKKESRL